MRDARSLATKQKRSVKKIKAVSGKMSNEKEEEEEEEEEEENCLNRK